jgi:hypothetical protein
MYSCCGFHHAVQQVVIKVSEENASFVGRTEASQVGKRGETKRTIRCNNSKTSGHKT